MDKARANSAERTKSVQLLEELSNKEWLLAYNKSLELEARLQKDIEYLQSRMNSKGSSRAQQMAIKSMKISLDALVASVTQMETTAITKGEISKTAGLKKKATTGDYAKEYFFFEQTLLASSSSQRNSRSPMAAAGSRRQSQNARRSSQNERSQRLSVNLPERGQQRDSLQICEANNESLQTSDLDQSVVTDNASNLGPQEDVFTAVFEEIKDLSRQVKTTTHKITGLTPGQRTQDVKESLVESWQQLETLIQQIETVLAEYSLGPRYHPMISGRERKNRQELFSSYLQSIIKDLQREYNFANQLKFLEDASSNSTLSNKAKIGGGIYSLDTKELDHKIQEKKQKAATLSKELEQAHKIDFPYLTESPQQKNDNWMVGSLGCISEHDRYEEMGTMGNLDDSRRSMGNNLDISRKSLRASQQSNRFKPPVEAPQSIMASYEEQSEQKRLSRKYKMIKNKNMASSALDNPKPSGCCGSQKHDCIIF